MPNTYPKLVKSSSRWRVTATLSNGIIIYYNIALHSLRNIIKERREFDNVTPVLPIEPWITYYLRKAVREQFGNAQHIAKLRIKDTLYCTDEDLNG